MADTDTPPPVVPPADPPAPPAPPADPEMGEAGKRALAAERAARSTAEREKKALETEIAQLRASTQTEGERAIATAKAEGASEAMKKANTRIIAAEVKLAANGKLANPDIALRLLPIDTFTVDDSGNVDSTAIASAIDALLVTDPYLAATAKPAPSGGSGDGGPQGKPPAGQLSKADLDRMRREGDTAGITKAFREGRLKSVQEG